MKIIRNKIIPFNGYKVLNLFGLLFVRENARLNDYIINHEAIHTAQMKELLYIPFYLIYVLEYLFKLIKYKPDEAYDNISFEKEAYANEKNKNYLKTRKHYAQWRKQVETSNQ